ncbi:MAG: DMT family transporter [Rivularia sp. (in: cyanobacteria)]
MAFSSIFIYLGEQELSSNSTVFNRFWISTIIYGTWSGIASFRRSSQNLEIQNNVYSYDKHSQHFSITVSNINKCIITIIIVGFCFCANQVIWSWSLEHTSIANSTILHNLTPIFTALGSYLFLNQRFDQKFLVGMLVAIAGATIMEVKDLSLGFERFGGDLAALASAMFYSAYLLAIEKLKDKLDIVNIVLGCCVVGCIIIIPLLLIQEDSLFPHSFGAWLSVIGLAVVCQIFGQAVIAYSLMKIPSGVVALSHLLCPCMSAIEAWLIFHQGLSIENLLGFIIILTGLYFGLSSTTARN